MNKKLVALLMAGAMIAGNAMAVMADETEAETTDSSEVTEVEFDETTASYEGTWVPFEAGFQLYIPSDWNIMEVSEENAANGIVFQSGAADDSGWNMAVTATALPEEYDIETLAAELDATYPGVQTAVFNDIEVAAYAIEDQAVMGIAFLDADGNMYTVTAGPTSDEEFTQVGSEMLYSLSIADTTEAETEAETAAE
ncbi:MAG: hypothetical protein PHE06_14140 [Lachnospiraceae bacterium]|nr:hypothetical protein [Lachnospiraceae bacterium]MDD3797074.1 hypothetical protein [Lachnospiraceae bacterium]